jgi:outer membrane protein
MNTKTTAVAAAAMALACAGAAHAQAYEPKTAGHFVLDVRMTDVAPDAGDSITTLAGAATGLKAKVSDSVMPTVGIQYFFTDNIAAELVLGTTKHTVKAVGGGANVKVKDTWVVPPVLVAQYHFMPKARFSPYVGAGLNYMIFYGDKNRNGFRLKIKDGWGTALDAGADYAIQGRWSANVDVKKIFFDTKATDTTNGVKSKVKLDPWVVSAGVGYRF